MHENTSHSVILYDGVCGLCNRLNQFLLKRDRNDRLRFASLQSEFAHTILTRHDLDPRDLDTVYAVRNYEQPNEDVLARSDAVLFALAELGGIWKWARAGKVLPKFFRDLFYKLVASNRYRIFGKYETCLMPDENYRRKFLDLK